MELDIHFVQDKVVCKKLFARVVPSIYQVGDVVTKSLSAPGFILLRSKLTLEESVVLLRGDVSD